MEEGEHMNDDKLLQEAEAAAVAFADRHRQEPSQKYVDGYVAGYLAHAAKAEVLVEAAERALKFGFCQTEHQGVLRNTHVDLREALAAYRKGSDE